ncbi:MAG: DUF655 domain-containing protein, partial [Burkholderiales bacterium]|nr:DUF655 domain-containing protein [Burkholderiales bacterium]
MKQILAALFAFFLTCGLALAAVDINSADETALDAIKGVGPAKAKAIVEERKKNGPFKSLDDVAARVKGIGEKTVADWKKDGSVSVGRGVVATKAEPAKKADEKKAEPAKKAAEKKADPATQAAETKAEPAKKAE